MFEIIDNQSYPEIFASAIVGYTIADGNLSLTLASTRSTWTDGVVTNKRVVVGRVILPISTANIMSIAMFDFLKKHLGPKNGAT